MAKEDRVDRTPGKKIMADEADIPVVMMFRPTYFEYVAPERLKEWEEALSTKVGLTKNAGLTLGGENATGGGPTTQRMKPGCATICGCSDIGWDDCDYWGIGC